MTTWTINQLDRNTSNNYVTTVHYNVTKVDGDFTASTYGTIVFEAGTPETPFESLTEATVLEWLWNKVDKEVVEAALAAQIAEQQAPSKATGTPWGQE